MREYIPIRVEFNIEPMTKVQFDIEPMTKAKFRISYRKGRRLKKYVGDGHTGEFFANNRI